MLAKQSSCSDSRLTVKDDDSLLEYLPHWSSDSHFNRTRTHKLASLVHPSQPSAGIMMKSTLVATLVPQHRSSLEEKTGTQTVRLTSCGGVPIPTMKRLVAEPRYSGMEV